jgi:hypothetical protein
MGQNIATTASNGNETLLKVRLANKVALVAEEQGLDEAGVAAKSGLDEELATAIVNGFIQTVPLFTIVECLLALGIDLKIGSSVSDEDKGQIFLDLQDEA